MKARKTSTRSDSAREDHEKEEVVTPGLISEIPQQALSPVNYEKIVERAIGQGGEELAELRRKARDAGMVRRGRRFRTFAYKRWECFSVGVNQYFLWFCPFLHRTVGEET